MQFVMGQRHAVFRAGTGKADDVFRADVGGENGRANDPPAQIAPGQEVVLCSVFAFAHNPPGNAQQEAEIDEDHEPVEAREG